MRKSTGTYINEESNMNINIKETKEDIINDLSLVKRSIDKGVKYLEEGDRDIVEVKREIMRAKRVINFQLRKIDEIQKAETQP